MKLDLILKTSLKRQKAITESPFSVNYPFRDLLQFFFIFFLQSCFSQWLVRPFFSESKVKNIFVGLICIRYSICTLLINAFIASAYPRHHGCWIAVAMMQLVYLNNKTTIKSCYYATKMILLT